jgi:hypothetical protein
MQNKQQQRLDGSLLQAAVGHQGKCCWVQQQLV